MVVLKWALLVILGLIVLLFAVGLFLPGTFHVERSVDIQAPPSRVHALVGDLRAWERWTPWKDEDPTIVVDYGERTTGVGASQTWVGESGDGELTFTASDPAGGVEYAMAFDDGKYPSLGALRYEPLPDGTRVTWSMDGESNGIVGRWFGIFMDGMVGPMFESGLQKLKRAAEADA